MESFDDAGIVQGGRNLRVGEENRPPAPGLGAQSPGSSHDRRARWGRVLFNAGNKIRAGWRKNHLANPRRARWNYQFNTGFQASQRSGGRTH